MQEASQVCQVKSVDHVGFVVQDVEATLEFYRSVFGVPEAPIVEMKERGLKAALVPLGETRLEFLQPTRANSEVSRFLERRGEGLHHVAFQVEDIQGKLELLKARGIELVEPEPRPGLTGMVAFIHPRATRGVLVELVQRF